MPSNSMRTLVTVASAILIAPALADLTGPGFSITAIDAATGRTDEVAFEGQWSSDGAVYRWTSSETHEFFGSDGTYLGSLNPAGETSSIEYIADPVINFTFFAAAGNSTTTFALGSALLSFPTINEAEARTSVGFSVTDSSGGDGATLTGLGGASGNAAYVVQYDVDFGTNTAATFAELIPSVVAAPFETATASATVPPSGYTPIGPARNMRTLLSFSLTAGDVASGTATFEIIPEPTTGMLLIAVGGALLARRR